LAEVKRLQHATLSAPLSLVLLSVYANHPWLVADGQHCAFTINPHRPASLSAEGTDLADNSLDGVACTEHHPSSGGVAGIVSVTISLLSIKGLAVALFHQSGVC